jgi:prolyl-tRNA synthetase
MAETMRMLEIYRSFAEETLAMPVIAGEKPAHERFPGAENTYSIEAMMQDGKALQSGTSHYLGTHFAQAEDIKFQAKSGDWEHCHTTSWGVSTRLVGGVIMSHGDDDGLRVPPRIAPRQIVIVPILRDKPEDADVLDYCEQLASALRSQSYASEAIRVLIDRRDERAVEKRWAWVKRGAPLICEIGGRDKQDNKVSFYRRDKLRNGERLALQTASRIAFVTEAKKLLKDIQDNLFVEAKQRLDENILTDVNSVGDLKDYFGIAGDDDEAGTPFRGWVRVPWKKPDSGAFAAIDAALKELKVSVRNAPLGQAAPSGRCIFSGAAADEEILIGRAY